MRAFRIAAIALLALLSSACSTGNEPSTSSSTPRVTMGSDARLRSALLTTKDVRSVRGLPSDIKVVSLDEAPVYEDPDPRGPCGAKVPSPDLKSGVGVVLRSASLSGFFFVLDPPDGSARSYIDRLEKDTRPGCAAYESTTNTGSTQRVQLVRPIALSGVGDQAHAVLVEITTNGRTSSAAEVVVRDGNALAFLVILVPTQPSDQVIIDLADIAAKRLAVV